jgi:CHAT domain-containing protein
MSEGQQAFQKGDFAGAVSNWQQAVHLYAETQQPQARSVVLSHLARAYAALGHADQAEASLRTALQLAEATGDQAQAALILGQRGDLALATGNVTEAAELVRQALGRAQELADLGLTATLLQTQGNVLMSQQHWPDALVAYRHSARVAQEAAQWGIAARALAHAALAAERAEQVHTATALMEDALAALRQALPSHDTATELLVIGRTYHRLAQTAPDLRLRAAAVFQEAAVMAQTLQDPRTLSYAWGYLGRLYEDASRYDEALALTRRAALTAQRIDAPAALYQWQWQTGRLLRALGDPQAALAAYSRAVETVQTLRATLGHGQWGFQATFRETVGALFVEQADLLLQQAARLEAQPQGRSVPQYDAYLQQARATLEQLKAAELRDYFGDACVEAIRPRVTALERVSPHTAIVYPILLAERTELLVNFPAGLRRVVVPVPGPQVEQRAQFLRRALEARDAERSLQHAQRLYHWLVQPLAAELAAGAVHTLVFVPDGALRLIPPAVLHDGQQYLIEKYAVAMTPSLTLTDPRPLSQDTVQVLAAGTAEAVAGFPPLPFVREELQAVQALYGGPMLLDQAFSPTRLETVLRQGNFAIVHLAAHGRFAPQAEESFLLTAQGKLTLAQLAQILGRLRFREQPVELLTLSACETAQGDDRAALGLAGVAIQVGARSALATLWQVADEATAHLMQGFYQHLRTAGVSKARALQKAQVTLLNDPRYADPFFWAPFLLLNNWL